MFRPVMFRPALLSFSLLAASCGRAAPATLPQTYVAAPTEAPLWVLAPHPDDEALFGAEPIRRALRAGRDVSVLVMTNGDLGCERDGHLRERETVAAMAELGLDEDRIHFLGYPDGYLDALGKTELAPLARRLADGGCGEGANTYASRGAGRVDVHTHLTGAPATYTAAHAVGDLAALLEREQPSDVYVAHPIDEHPDHATTYVILRRALEAARLSQLPRVHRALVHVGGCWPNGDRPREPCEPITGPLGAYPRLPEPLDAYRPNEILSVDDGGATARRAISHYGSQLHVDADHDWLGAFARADAIAWTETLVSHDGHAVRARDTEWPSGFARASGPVTRETVGEATRLTRVIEHRAPIAIVVETTIEDAAAIELAIFSSSMDDVSNALRVAIDAREVVFSRGTTVLRRAYVPDVAGAHRWSLRVDPRPDEGGVLELELRRDGVPAAYAIDLATRHEGSVVHVVSRGRATVGDPIVVPR